MAPSPGAAVGLIQLSSAARNPPVVGSQVPNRGSSCTSAFFSWSRMAVTSVSVSGPPWARTIDVATKSLVAWLALGIFWMVEL